VIYLTVNLPVSRVAEWMDFLPYGSAKLRKLTKITANGWIAMYRDAQREICNIDMQLVRIDSLQGGTCFRLMSRGDELENR
jgi:hypothetical protein